ncbi:flagellar biosynthetic protein FliO [Corallococcus sp. bb12-1]|uniref:flagellar biosynthetic protein FliO n=1 Tax=Corallococcus sp. bb12-1 TaxID=2996784 RepID=UPI00226FEE06|nr:flagellar biosynthetic protein FliO [Corallococcus sp. bb12-1]MCY1045165.1 flagellar biosynthetic protein FliO [Corallococcus sp. bb12-1]
MAVLSLSSSRGLLGAALLFASSAVLAQAPVAPQTTLVPAAPPAKADAVVPPAAPKSSASPVPATGDAAPAAPKVAATPVPQGPPAKAAATPAPVVAPPAKAEAPVAAPPTPQAPEPDAANPADRASRHADELDKELGIAAPEEQESLGWVVVRTVALLGAVLASIYLTLNVGLRRLMGLQGVPVGKASVVSVMERIPLDQRRTLFVLKAADEYLLVGGGEGGVQLVSKLDRDAVERIRAARPPSSPVSLSPFLQKLLSRRTGGPTPPPGA